MKVGDVFTYRNKKHKILEIPEHGKVICLCMPCGSKVKVDREAITI